VTVPQPLMITLKKPTQQQVQEATKEPSKNALAKAALEAGNASLQNKQYAEARAQYEKALGLLEVDDPSLKMSVQRTIAQTYYEEKQLDKAVEVLKKSLELVPNDPETLQLLVNLLVAQNKEEEAKTYMAQLPQGTKIDPAARLNIGIKAYNEKKLDEALKQFDQVVQENPSMAEAYYYRGLVYLNMNKSAEAKADFQKLLEIDPKNQYADDAREFLKSL
jgi:tetratricopeptide (TPR) repeat protein